jgi:2-keto-4-pentenoate hydratase/2-oxohepta-3-ene-1,7-dioic acid hydratase in catechol pathway
MKLLRFGEIGSEKPGALDASGTIRDLSGVIDDLAGANLGKAGLKKLAELNLEDLPAVDPSTRLGAPVAGTRSFVGIGLNYFDHAEEAGQEIPKWPVVFLKSPGSICGPDDDVVLPPGSRAGDWEVELAIVIGETAKSVPVESALDYVAGFTICNDVSEREWQMFRGGTWDKGKSFDTFGPLGPWLVTTDEVADCQDLGLTLSVNGVEYQNGTTAKMIFPVAELVAYCSQCMTLIPGDVITTGTPAGIGGGKKPPVFLKIGDKMELAITGLGTQAQRVA